jgi:hypothetical protein
MLILKLMELYKYRRIIMAEILIRVAANRKDGKEIVGRHRFGETIAVCEDGHKWSDTERNNPAWLIVAIPGVSATSLMKLLETYTDEEKLLIESKQWDGVIADGRRRAWKLDVFSLSALLANEKETAIFLENPSWEAAEKYNLVVRWDS